MKIMISLLGVLFVFGLSQKTLACDCDKNAKKDKVEATNVADNHDSKQDDTGKSCGCGDAKSCKCGKSCKHKSKDGESCGGDGKSCNEGKSCADDKKTKA